MDSIRSPISERGDAAAGVNSIDSEHGQGSRSGQRLRVSCCVMPESMWQRSSWAYLHAECVLASYRVRNWCLGEACARFIARAPTGPSRVLREVVVRSLETRLQLHATLLWVARRRALCCMWDGMGTGQGGALALGTGIIRAHMRVVGWLQACLIRM